MRLIDADRFAEISKHHIPEVLEDTFDEGYIACLKAVDLTPTAKAIPIEWIKKWCNIKHKSCEERLMLRYGVITMLEDWEKEYGIQNKKTDNIVE